MGSDSSDHLHIVMAASEAVPYAKTGGLADVVGALSVALAKLGHQVTLLVPGYRTPLARKDRRVAMQFSVPVGGAVAEVSIEEESLTILGAAHRVRVLFVCHDPSYDRPGLYQEDHRDYPDNLDRFMLFCRAVIHVLHVFVDVQKEKINILHLHDWQTALCAVYLKVLADEHRSLQSIKTLLTVHNLGYQGVFPGQEFMKTGLPAELFSLEGLEFYGAVNCLKGGIIFSDAVSTVSPTYAREILTAEYGCGLEGVLANRPGGVSGITNGIDEVAWDPACDTYLSAKYHAKDLSGKYVCKQALQQELGLPTLDVPLVAVLGRLTFQKGFDLLLEILPELMALDLQLVVLGTGDPHLEQQFIAAKEQYHQRIGLSLGFNEGLAHRVEAGSDMLVMPSRYEPCGLSQLYSLRYGTVPIVRCTGGLADTVVPFRPSTVKAGSATGFQFVDPSPDALLSTMLLALRVYDEQAAWRALVIAGMNADLSWDRSARTYIDLYRRL